MTKPAQIQPVYLIGQGLACTQASPADFLGRQESPDWSQLPVGGHQDIHRPYGLLAGRECPMAALDRVLSQALDKAGLDTDKRRDAAVILGTSSLDIGRDEQRIADALSAGEETAILEDARWGFMLDELCRRHGLKGPQYTFNTACSSSANAMLYAQRILSLDLAPAAVVIGFDAYNGISFGGFNSLMLLSSQAYRPFDLRRDGIVISEGVAAMVLSRHSDRAMARFDGGHTSIDTSGITVASEQSLMKTMQHALHATGAQSDVLALKAHGTGTPGNDSAESNAIFKTFDGAPPPFFSLKGGLGHAMGACAAVELLVLLDCAKAGFMPASIGYEERDPELLAEPSRERLDFNGGRLLLNHFGFGGNNTSLVVSL